MGIWLYSKIYIIKERERDICWGICVGFLVGVIFLICMVGVVKRIVWVFGIVGIMFILGVMWRIFVVEVVGVVIVNCGVVSGCILVNEFVVILIGISFWIWSGIGVLFGEFLVFGVMCCLVVVLNGWIWINVYVMLLFVLEFVCVLFRVVFVRDRGVSLIGLFEITIIGGLDWVFVVIVFVLVVVLVVFVV